MPLRQGLRRQRLSRVVVVLLLLLLILLPDVLVLILIHSEFFFVDAITNSQVVSGLALRLLLIPRHHSNDTIICNTRIDIDVICVQFDTTTSTNTIVGSTSASADTTFVVLAFILGY